MSDARPHANLIHTKLAPPRLPRHTLPRPRLMQRLAEALDVRLTIVHAGAGYGKSTALAGLARESADTTRFLWYHLDPEDVDPQHFLLHLTQGLMSAAPGLSDAPLAMLEEWERSAGNGVWTAVVDRLVGELSQQLDEPLLVVFDDAHHLAPTTALLRILDHFIARAPAPLHVILSTRYPLKLPSLVTWRLRGQVLEIGQEELAFTTAETLALFRDHYDHALTPQQARDLMEQIEGWPIALPLVWQRLQHTSLPQALGEVSGASGDLITFLAREVLQQLPPDVQTFLSRTAVLRHMTPTICDCLLQAEGGTKVADGTAENRRSAASAAKGGTTANGVADAALPSEALLDEVLPSEALLDEVLPSEALLQYLLENGLFVADAGDGRLRYHHLFRDLLTNRLTAAERRAAHRRAATCYGARDQHEEAVYHLLAAGAHEEAARLLAGLGPALLRAGRLDRLARWIGALPPDLLQANPLLLVHLGDIARLHSRFDEALGWYQQAEERSRAHNNLRELSQALRGQARVYLDTVNPSQAEQLLQEALRLSDGQEDRESRARLLELLAENLLNQGRAQQAQDYQAQARRLREQGPGEAELSVRVLLRTGRLDEARRLLQEQLASEREQPVLQPRAHRETLLLLALILAFQGQRDAAYDYAVQGTERGQAFDSPFVTAVGYMRQGHAWLLDKDANGYAEATRCFRRAVAISEELSVPRLKVEACWGLCQAYGFRGDLQEAERIAREGAAIARRAGDEWVEACIRVTMGASLVLAQRHDEAQPWLSQAAASFRACADPFGESTVRLWQCLLWQHTDDEARLARDVAELLRLSSSNGFDYLFRRKTLGGPPDPRSLVPLLIFARDNDCEASYARRLLAHLNLAGVQIHPGYRLRVQTLGPFRLWRGAQEVPDSDWTRKKARQLFHLLLTYHHTMLEREQITEMLWPDLDPETAERDFKIAYSALNNVLEPRRRRNAPVAYVRRDGSRYGLRHEADLWLDAAQFERLIEEGDGAFEAERQVAATCYRRALDLYHGEYLQEFPYAEWASEERERLLILYLRSAERLAGAYLQAEEWAGAIDVSQAILARDDCWEEAYRIMMQAYARQGNRAQAVRLFHRCRDCLQSELGVDPAPATVQVYESLQ